MAIDASKSGIAPFVRECQQCLVQAEALNSMLMSKSSASVEHHATNKYVCLKCANIIDLLLVMECLNWHFVLGLPQLDSYVTVNTEER